MTTVPLTVLAYEGPLARAYLARMRRAGLRPKRVVLIVQSHHPATKKPIGRWLPYRARLPYAQRMQECANLYWPRRIRATQPNLVSAILREMAKTCDNPTGLIAEILGCFRYDSYPQQIERVLVKDLRDEALVEALGRMEPGAVLFTGGGLLPPAVVDLPGLRFLHVHPGYLPRLRGADGLLWSLLVRGRPGMSCFYMAPGIDLGDVIMAKDYPALRFDLSGLSKPDDQTLYRAIFSFCDPLLRAEFFVQNVLSQGTDPASLLASSQKPEQGITYHFMHPALRHRVLSRML